MNFTGSPRVVMIVGDPVAQVPTLEVCNQLFRRHGVDAALVPMKGLPQLAGFVLNAFQAQDLDGTWVTLPHKTAMPGLMDRCDALATLAGVVKAVRGPKAAPSKARCSTACVPSRTWTILAWPWPGGPSCYSAPSTPTRCTRRLPKSSPALCGRSVAATALLVVVSQRKVNVTNAYAYACSWVWSSFFPREPHIHPGRVVYRHCAPWRLLPGVLLRVSKLSARLSS